MNLNNWISLARESWKENNPTLYKELNRSGKLGDGAQGSGGTDLFGGERSGGQRSQPSGSVGNDAGEVSAPASRERAGRGGEQGGKPVQRGERAAKPNSSRFKT